MRTLSAGSQVGNSRQILLEYLSRELVAVAPTGSQHRELVLSSRCVCIFCTCGVCVQPVPVVFLASGTGFDAVNRFPLSGTGWGVFYPAVVTPLHWRPLDRFERITPLPARSVPRYVGVGQSSPSSPQRRLRSASCHR